jgi:lysophospholipase L1-like esterase
MVLCAVRVGAAQVSGGTAATNPVPRVEAWWVARHYDKVAEARRGGVDLLFVGDSITENYEKTGPAPDEAFRPVWDEFFSGHRAMNLGFSGDDTEHVLWRLEHGEVEGIRPRDVVLLIGTNNTARGQRADEVAGGVIAVVEALKTRLPGARVLVLGILPSGISAEKSAADARVNALVAARYAGAKDVRTLDLSGYFMRDGALDAELFYDPRLHPAKAPLHPDVVGQRRMARAVAEALFGPLERAPGN